MQDGGGFPFKKMTYQRIRPDQIGYEAYGAPDLLAAHADEEGLGHTISNTLVFEDYVHRFALVARRHTDLLLIGMHQWPEGHFASPRLLTGRAAWISLAFFIRLAAAVRLDIEPLELQVGHRTLMENHQITAQIFLADQLENGAGYCHWLGKPEHFLEILQAVDLNPGTLACDFLASKHQTCQTSCNFCLRDYSNLPYHSVLDWRLALDMARLLRGDADAVDMESPWSENIPNPWADLMQAGGQVEDILSAFKYEFDRTLEGLKIYRNARNRYLVMHHPLWTEQHPTLDAIKHQLRTQCPQSSVKFLSPWLLLRRPASCLE